MEVRLKFPLYIEFGGVDRHVIMRRMKLLLFAALWSSIPAVGQEPPTLFRVSTELVLVDVQVLHSKTRTPAPLLRSTDLQVFEDGLRQEIRYFSRDEVSLSVVLLFDLTETVHGVLKRLADGAASALAHLKPQDEVAVMTYAAHAHLIDGFTTNRERTIRAIAQAALMKLHEPAHFNEALFQSATHLSQSERPANRRVVIWFTDNLPNVPFRTRKYPAHTEREALRVLNEHGVVVMPILMTNRAWLPLYAISAASEAAWRKAYPPGDARRYAELTGGFVTGLRGKDAERSLMEVIDELRQRYTVG